MIISQIEWDGKEFWPIDAEIEKAYHRDQDVKTILMTGESIKQMVTLAEKAGALIRVFAQAKADAIQGFAVTGYKHPVTGDTVAVYPIDGHLANVMNADHPGTVFFSNVMPPASGTDPEQITPF